MAHVCDPIILLNWRTSRQNLQVPSLVGPRAGSISQWCMQGWSTNIFVFPLRSVVEDPDVVSFPLILPRSHIHTD